MRNLMIATGLAALVAAAPGAQADGPVRQGLRATGEAAAQGTRAVVRGTGQVLQGAGQATRTVVGGAADETRTVVGGAANATRNVIGGTVDATGRVIGGAADATRAVVGGTARGVAAGVDALTPGLPLQARGGATLTDADRARDARWRFAQHNGEWWYYSPENSWSYHRDGNWNRFDQNTFAANPNFSGQYSAAYRGTETGAAIQGGAHLNSGRVHRLQHDAQGREFIIDGGQRIYFDNHQAQQPSQGMSADQQGNQPTPTPAIPTDADASVDAPAPAAQTPTAPAGPSASGAADGGLAPGSPRDINQNSPATEATQGAPGVGESAR